MSLFKYFNIVRVMLSYY